MGTTQSVVGVGPGALGSELATKMLDCRLSLPQSGSGHKPPSVAAAAQIRKDIRQGRSKEWSRLMTVALCDVTDGVDHELVEAPFLMAVAAIRAVAHVIPDRPFPPVFRHEQKRQCRVDLAQFAVAANPHDHVAIAELLAACDEYVAPFEEIRALCRRKLTERHVQQMTNRGGRRKLALHA